MADDLAKEVREASEAVAKAARTRSADDAAKAADESMDVVRIGLARGWTWQAWLSAAVAVGLLACGAFYVGSRTETPVVERKVEPVKGKVGDEADITKLLTDGFDKLEKSMTTGFVTLGKKIDEKPVPPPVDPDKPKPPSGLIPSKVSIAVGPAAIKVVASNASAQWYWESGLSVDVHAGYVYVSAMKDGEYLLVAYVSDGKKINDFAACRVTAGTAPQPPPVPPEPKPPVPPTPQDWPTTAPGLRVLIVFEEMERDKLTAAQRAIINSAPIRDNLDTKCVQDGTVKAWRIWDKDIGLQGAEKHWKEMMSRKRASVPWVVICNYPKAAYEGVLPASVDEFKTLIQKVE